MARRRSAMLIPDLSARRAHRHIAFLLSLAALTIPGCEEEERRGTTYGPAVAQVELTIGAEAFEPPVVHVPAGQVELTVHNETAREQTVVVDGAELLTIPAGGTGGADLGTLREGRHPITLQGTPFEATLVAEPG